MHVTEITPQGHLVVALDGATVVIDDNVASNLWVIKA